MSTLLVGYDLHRPGQDYSDLHKFLEAQTTWWHALDSTWIVVTSHSTAGLLDEIKRFIDANDEIFVVDIKGDPWASLGLGDVANNWLKQHV